MVVFSSEFQICSLTAGLPCMLYVICAAKHAIRMTLTIVIMVAATQKSNNVQLEKNVKGNGKSVLSKMVTITEVGLQQTESLRNDCTTSCTSGAWKFSHYVQVK